eukprot:6184519-Amphidinium_carterae.2
MPCAGLIAAESLHIVACERGVKASSPAGSRASSKALAMVAPYDLSLSHSHIVPVIEIMCVCTRACMMLATSVVSLRTSIHMDMNMLCAPILMNEGSLLVGLHARPVQDMGGSLAPRRSQDAPVASHFTSSDYENMEEPPHTRSSCVALVEATIDAFRRFDADNDGHITREELVLRSCTQ